MQQHTPLLSPCALHPPAAGWLQVWLRQAENAEDTGLFLELPHVLRNEVSWHVNHNMFRWAPPAALVAAALAAAERRFAPRLRQAAELVVCGAGP